MLIVPKIKMQYPMAIEREYAKVLRSYVREELKIIREFIPEMTEEALLNGIQADARQDGWIGNILDKVTNAIEERLRPLEGVIKIFNRVKDFAKKQQEKIFESVFGASPKRGKMSDYDKIKEDFINDNLALIKSIDSRTVEAIRYALSRNIIKAANKARIIEELTETIKHIGSVNEKRAVLIATDQVGKLNSQLAQYEQMRDGIERYIWVTKGDSRVRPLHRERHGVSYRWDSPPSDGHPGWPIRCRCVAKPLIDLSSFKLTPKPTSFTPLNKNGIIAINIDGIGEAHIPIDKLLNYSLDLESNNIKAKAKAEAFKSALGYEKENAFDLIKNVEKHINEYPTAKGKIDEYGERFSITMNLKGLNGKNANVLMAWIFDREKNEVRMTNIYVDKKKGRSKNGNQNGR